MYINLTKKKGRGAILEKNLLYTT